MMGVIDQMLKPSAVGVDEINPNRAKITLEPLERGFGLTLGNALRRTLLAAIQGAIDAGAQYVEIDVQETADGEIVVIHDSDLKKVGGVPLVVGESTLQQLGYTDIGSWFDLSFSDQRIPTLREVLALCKDRIRVNIELKYYGHEKRLEQSVAELVDEAGMADQVIAMSLSYSGIQTLHRLRPAWTVGLLSTVAIRRPGRRHRVNLHCHEHGGEGYSMRIYKSPHCVDAQRKSGEKSYLFHLGFRGRTGGEDRHFTKQYLATPCDPAR